MLHPFFSQGKNILGHLLGVVFSLLLVAKKIECKQDFEVVVDHVFVRNFIKLLGNYLVMQPINQVLVGLISGIGKVLLILFRNGLDFI